MAALEKVAPTGPGADALREAVRAEVTEGGHRFDTNIGPVGFDDAGDSTQQVIQIRRVEDASGPSDPWVTVIERDYGEGS